MAIDTSLLPLGKTTQYPDRYDPSQLVAVPRHVTRDFWPAATPLPFSGHDSWTGYEVSWLNRKGKPQVATLLLDYDALSPCIVESKSLKLYLNSLNQTHFDHADAVLETLANDLAGIVGTTVSLSLHDAGTAGPLSITPWAEHCIDHRDIEISEYLVNPSLLAASPQPRHRQAVVSHLLRSLCPVTGQPDWASVRIEVHGITLCEDSLLRYICSYRKHQGFHEQCIERIFCDIWQQCRPEQLSVEGRFTRRGGLDINPFRCSHDDMTASGQRQVRQ